MTDITNKELLDKINRVSKENGHGDMSSVIFNTFYGINHRGTGAPIPTNADQHGLTFFTRPNLNMSYDNLKTERIFLPLLDKRGSRSIFTAIRLLLDKDAFDTRPGDTIKSDLIDNKNPFICLLSNTLTSFSGWPDIALDTYASKEGRARESWSMGDGKTRNLSVYPCSASFRNMIGDPITLLFFYWVNYISLVYEGRITPKIVSIVENEIDYNTRIYRLVLDPSRTYVRKISCCGAAFPTSSPIGASHNFSVDAPYNMENKDVSINFQMMGADYLDPIVVREFNTLVDMFTGGVKKKGYIKLADRKEKDVGFKRKDGDLELTVMNHRGIPHIDPITFELEWYVEESVFNQEMNEGKSTLYGTQASGGADNAVTPGPEGVSKDTQQPAQSGEIKNAGPFNFDDGYMATTDRLPTTEEMVAGTYLTPDNTPQVVAGNPTPSTNTA
jgi:hypothetical protein